MKRFAEQLIGFAAGHRTAVFTVLVLLGSLAALSLFRVSFTNDVSRMFPDSRDAGTTFRVLNETKLGNTVQLEFIVPDSIEKHEKYLEAAWVAMGDDYIHNELQIDERTIQAFKRAVLKPV